MKYFVAGCLGFFFISVSWFSNLEAAATKRGIDKTYSPPDRDYSNKPVPLDNNSEVTCVGDNCPSNSIKGNEKAPPEKKRRSPSFSCPSDTKLCESKEPGGANDCCASNQRCMRYGDYDAACMPNDPSACKSPKTLFCPQPPNSLPSGDTACCDPNKETCETWTPPIEKLFPKAKGGVAYCKFINCSGKEVHKCGPKCCPISSPCGDNACSPKTCANGTPPCGGTFNLCCKANETCSPGGKGNPNCIPNPVAPPVSTEPPRPSSSPTPS